MPHVAVAVEVARELLHPVVGRGLQQVESVPPDVLERSRRLCERRIEVTRNSGSPSDYQVEMKAVGWLFASSKFDDDWALTQLRSALEVSGKADPDREVVQRLATLAPAHPRATVECLGLMVDGDREGWRIRYWGNLARNILAAARQSEYVAAQQSAVALINRLGARGFIEFQDLL